MPSPSQSVRHSAWLGSILTLLTVSVGCIDKPKVRNHGALNGGQAGMAQDGEASGADGLGEGGGEGGESGESGNGNSGAAGEPGSAGEAGAAGSAGAAGAADPGSPAQTVVKVSYQVARQQIDGFGVATAWNVIPPVSRLDAFFSVSKGAGLSILRNRIPFRERPGQNDNFMGGGNYDFTTAGSEFAQYKIFNLNWNNWDLLATRHLIASLKGNPDYQVPTCFSTPWTPPNNDTSRWKLGVADYVNAPEVGGYLDPAHYQDYADVLADYVLGFASHMGAPLTALSLQNEPDFLPNYESAGWSGAQFRDFLSVLKAEFEKKGVFSALPGFTILAPETTGFNETLILPSLADSETAPLFSIVGVHHYDFVPGNAANYAPKPLAKSLAAGKKVWVTEWNTSAFYNETPLATAFLLAGLIQADLTVGSASAYVHWWYDDLVDGAGAPNKSLWALGHFSRFVRPGSSRLEAPTRLSKDLLLAAFKNAPGTELTLVAINRGSQDTTFAIELDSGTLGAVTSYRTSASEDLVNLGSVPSGGSFANVTAKAQSINTYVVPVRP
jgi:O-glycosyl hydrolase